MKHTSKRLQALVLVLAMCVSFLQIPSFALTEGHQYTYGNSSFEANGNYTIERTCVTHPDEKVVPLTGTATDDQKTTKEATCENNATVTYKIVLTDDLGTTKTFTSNAFEIAGTKKGHDLKDADPIIETPATCTTGATYYNVKKCSRCSYTEKGSKQTSVALGHDYKDGKCTRCGEPEKTPDPTHKHVTGDPEYAPGEPATCTKDGHHFMVYKCTIVGCPNAGSIVYSEKVIDPAKHTDVKTTEKVITPATCAKEGSKVVTTKCEACGKVINEETQAIAKTSNHLYKIVDENDTATCEAAGTVDKVTKCVVCGNEAKRETVTSKKKGHVNADPVKENVVEPTCNEKGSYDVVTYCKTCGKQLNSETVTVRATGHKKYVKALEWDDKDTITGNDKLTCKVIEKCAICGEKKATYSEPAKVVEDTTKAVAQKFDCQPGSKTFVATFEYFDENNKKVTLTDTKTVAYYKNDKHDHDLGTPIRDDDSIVKATCVKDGSYNLVKICKVCGEKEVVATLPIDATGKHTAAAAKKENVVAATTKKGGSYDLVVRCADCGEIISSTHKTTAKIVVKASKINSVKNYKGKKAKVTVKKTSSIIGYQIQYGTKKNFKGAKHVNTRKTSKYLTKLAKNKKYYVRVRTYKTVDGKLYFSSWSGAKTVTIKK